MLLGSFSHIFLSNFGGIPVSHPLDFFGLIFSSACSTSATEKSLNSKLDPLWASSYGLNTAVVAEILFCDVIHVVSTNTQCHISEIFG